MSESKTPEEWAEQIYLQTFAFANFKIKDPELDNAFDCDVKLIAQAIRQAELRGQARAWREAAAVAGKEAVPRRYDPPLGWNKACFLIEDKLNAKARELEEK